MYVVTDTDAFAEDELVGVFAADGGYTVVRSGETVERTYSTHRKPTFITDITETEEGDGANERH